MGSYSTWYDVFTLIELQSFFVSLFDVLGPDSLVAGIGRVEGTQAQGDHPGEQVRDHCETSSQRSEEASKANLLYQSSKAAKESRGVREP